MLFVGIPHSELERGFLKISGLGICQSKDPTMVNTIGTEEGSYVSGNEFSARFGPKTPISALCVEALGFGFRVPDFELRDTKPQEVPGFGGILDSRRFLVSGSLVSN